MTNVTYIPIADPGAARPAPPRISEDAFAVMEQVMLRGDLVKLSEEERIRYYMTVCKSLGLNPLTRPFEYITLDGKLTLYATRAAADQLRALHDVSISILGRETVDTVHIVHVKAMTADGRDDEDVGSVSLVHPMLVKKPHGYEKHPKAGQPLTELDLANALMKAVTKAKRRVTLSICGLGFVLDETEVEDMLAAGRGAETKASVPVRPTLTLVDTVPEIFAGDDLPSADGQAAAAVETVPWATFPATTHELPGGPAVASSIPVYAPEVVDAAVAAMTPETYTPETIEQAPLHGALRRMAEHVKKRRAAECSTGPRAPDPAVTAAVDAATSTLIAELQAVAHHPGRLTARHGELASRIARLSDDSRQTVESTYAALLTAARAAHKTKR